MCYDSMPFSWFSCLVSECFGCHYVACAFVACAHHSRVLIKLAVVALGGGPQPGGVEYPPNPRGWIPGVVQAILQIYPRSQNTRTHQDLEWFGPPERNTLRPLGVVLLLSLQMRLSSASRSLPGRVLL